MPVKDRIGLGEGRLYFRGIDGAVKIEATDILTEDDVLWEDDLKCLSINPEPVTFECEAEINRDWTLASCGTCGCEFPVTQFYALLYGREGWTCPGCTFRKILKERMPDE